ncbi:MAG: histidine kinase [Bacteroidota bacterium]
MSLTTALNHSVVLYVDDEPRNLFLFKAAFRRYYTIITADNGDEALEILKSQKVQLLISDQRMPGMTGVELLEMARNISPSTTRMIMTAYSDVNVTIDAINKGKIFHFIPKPWDINELKNIIDNALEIYWLKEENLLLQKERNRLALKAENQEKENIIAQFKILKNQINPHFLFNCLNTLYSMMRDHYPGKEFIAKLSKVYRYVLTFKEKTSVELQDEIDFINDYIYLQKMRYGESLNFDIRIEEQYLDCNIPPLAIQLLIENAIKHNVVSQTRPLNIELFVEGEEYLVVRNNFQKRSDFIHSTGVGQKNIAERYSYISTKLPVFQQQNAHYVAKIPLLT